MAGIILAKYLEVEQDLTVGKRNVFFFFFQLLPVELEVRLVSCLFGLLTPFVSGPLVNQAETHFSEMNTKFKTSMRQRILHGSQSNTAFCFHLTSLASLF